MGSDNDNPDHAATPLRLDVAADKESRCEPFMAWLASCAETCQRTADEIARRGDEDNFEVRRSTLHAARAAAFREVIERLDAAITAGRAPAPGQSNPAPHQQGIDVLTAERWARAITRGSDEPHFLDSCCAQCRPDGRWVQPGYVCTYHEARAYLDARQWPAAQAAQDVPGQSAPPLAPRATP